MNANDVKGSETWMKTGARIDADLTRDVSVHIEVSNEDFEKYRYATCCTIQPDEARAAEERAEGYASDAI